MMSPSLDFWGPWVLLMMRTSWPRTTRFWYNSSTCWLTPPGKG